MFKANAASNTMYMGLPCESAISQSWHAMQISGRLCIKKASDKREGEKLIWLTHLRETLWKTDQIHSKQIHSMDINTSTGNINKYRIERMSHWEYF